jgi:transcriptional regulator with XRE-family HTH domain
MTNKDWIAKTHIARNLRYLRDYEGLSLEVLSEVVEIDVNSLSQIENNMIFDPGYFHLEA